MSDKICIVKRTECSDTCSSFLCLNIALQLILLIHCCHFANIAIDFMQYAYYNNSVNKNAPQQGCKIERKVIQLSFQRQNKFYEEHKDDDDYKYMKKYSSYKSRAKSFVTKFASEQDFLNLITLINQRLEEFKGLTDKMESTLN